MGVQPDDATQPPNANTNASKARFPRIMRLSV